MNWGLHYTERERNPQDWKSWKDQSSFSNFVPLSFSAPFCQSLLSSLSITLIGKLVLCPSFVSCWRRVFMLLLYLCHTITSSNPDRSIKSAKWPPWKIIADYFKPEAPYKAYKHLPPKSFFFFVENIKSLTHAKSYENEWYMVSFIYIMLYVCIVFIHFFFQF